MSEMSDFIGFPRVLDNTPLGKVFKYSDNGGLPRKFRIVQVAEDEFEKRKILAQVAYWEYYRSVVLPLMKDDISKQWELTAKVAEEGILCK